MEGGEIMSNVDRDLLGTVRAWGFDIGNAVTVDKTPEKKPQAISGKPKSRWVDLGLATLGPSWNNMGRRSRP